MNEMSGYDDFLVVLKNFRSLSATAVGAGAVVPFACYIGRLSPPWPPGIMLATGVVELVAIILAFQLAHAKSRKSISRSLIVLAAGWILFSSIYLSLFAAFTYTTRPTGERLVSGFICLQDIAQIEPYKGKCPFLSDEEISDGRYEAAKFWEPWTIITAELALVIAWTCAFILLSGLVGTFISFQTRVPSRKIKSANAVRVDL